jgi:hypothetical protein
MGRTLPVAPSLLLAYRLTGFAGWPAQEYRGRLGVKGLNSHHASNKITKDFKHEPVPTKLLRDAATTPIAASMA